MANYTEHYQLHQWESSGSSLRTDFNQDSARIDTGIRAAKTRVERLERGRAKINIGAYIGDNAASRAIHLGFRSKAILVEMALGSRYEGNGDESINGGLTIDSWPVSYQDINGPCTPAIQTQADGFAVTQDSRNRSYMNYSGTRYYYFVVKQNIPPGIARGDASI